MCFPKVICTSTLKQKGFHRTTPGFVGYKICTPFHSGCSLVGTNIPASVAPAAWILLCIIIRNFFYLLPGLLKNLPRKSHVVGSFMWLNIGSNTRAAPSLANEVQGLSRCNFWDVRGITQKLWSNHSLQPSPPVLFVQRWPNPGLVCRSNLAHAIRCHVRHPSCVHLATFASCCRRIAYKSSSKTGRGPGLALSNKDTRGKEKQRGGFQEHGNSQRSDLLQTRSPPSFFKPAPVYFNKKPPLPQTKQQSPQIAARNVLYRIVKIVKIYYFRTIRIW